MQSICLYGPLKSGKDTVASYFVEELGYRRLAFADELKLEVCYILNTYEDTLKANYTIADIDSEKDKYRPFLQWWGMYRREEDPDYWVHKVERVMTWNKNQGYDKFIITDARFINELTMAKENNFLLVKLNKDPALEKESDDKHKTHISEIEWQNFKPDMTRLNKKNSMHLTVRDIAKKMGLNLNTKEIKNFYLNR